MIPQYLLGVFAWGVHYLLQGIGLATLATWFAARFPGLTGGDFDVAVAAAQQAIEVTGNMLNLQLSDPLYEALAGASPPAQSVNVRSRVQFELPDGTTEWRTIDREFDWTTQVGAVYGEIASEAARIGRDYNMRVVSIDIVPPTLFPRI